MEKVEFLINVDALNDIIVFAKSYIDPKNTNVALHLAHCKITGSEKMTVSFGTMTMLAAITVPILESNVENADFNVVIPTSKIKAKNAYMVGVAVTDETVSYKLGTVAGTTYCFDKMKYPNTEEIIDTHFAQDSVFKVGFEPEFLIKVLTPFAKRKTKVVFDFINNVSPVRISDVNDCESTKVLACPVRIKERD